MNAQSPSSVFPLAAVGAAWMAATACLATMVVIDVRLTDLGRSDLQQILNSNALFLIPFASALIVGSALAIRRPTHPVGWLFLILAISIVLGGVIDAYAAYGAVAKPGSLPGAEVVAVLGASTFIPWIMLPGLILLLTPSGHLTDRWTRLATWTTVTGGLFAILAGLLRPYNGIFASLGVIRNPLEVSTGADLLYVVRWGGIIAVHLGVVAGAVAIVARFRAARSAERLQLRWLGMAAVPALLLIFGASVAAVLNVDVVAGALAGCFVAIIPLAVGLSIEQYHLYDVDRLVSRAVTWLVLTAALIATYIVVVVFVGQSIGSLGDSQIPAIIATLAAATAFAPLRRWIQDALDRRFNRRRFETLARLRAYARDPSPTMSVDQALRTATGDPTLTVTYWIADRDIWVNENGVPTPSDPAGVTIERRGETTCILSFNPSALDRATAKAAAAEVIAELENARLRAAIALQLVEVRESRARIVDAQLAERHRIERDLHDGAQQRLLGLALHLRAAELSGETGRMRPALALAVDELQQAVRDLRELANGLRPAVLTDGGLAAALDDLAARSPVPVHIEMTEERFAADVEEAAWFIACEAVTNAVKHAAPHSIVIATRRTGTHLRLLIEDDGIGGADPTGSGLRGIADRAEVAGGTLTIQPRNGHGTVVIAELPCASS